MAHAHGDDAEQYAATIAPYVDDQTVLVAHVDVSRIDVDATAAMLSAFLPAESDAKRQMDQAAFVAKAWLGGFQKAGGRDIYAAISVSDIGRRDAPEVPIFLIVPIADGSRASTITAAIPTSKKKNSPLQMATRIPDDGPVVLGNRVTIARLKTLYGKRGARDRDVALRL
ncbi:MAG: hypothetical protein ACC645_17090, partial [Pirellulales bacterium]